ncbi:MAG: alpha-amylase family glycosyl hydrolase [bacterium]
MLRAFYIAAFSVLLAAPALSEEPPQTPDARPVPGVQPTPWLRYANPAAQKVEVAGTWSVWSNRTPLQLSNNVWTIDTRTFGAKPGRHEFKFLPNEHWESGDNRTLFLNDDGFLERPPDVVISATVESPTEILVYLKQKVTPSDNVKVTLDPDVAVTSVQVAVSAPDTTGRGYSIAGNTVTFSMDEKNYSLTLAPETKVTVAGNFNNWDSGGGPGGPWILRDPDNDGVWEAAASLVGLRPAPPDKDLFFKFVVDGSRWLAPPATAANATPDGKGNTNLRLGPRAANSSALKILTGSPLALSENYTLVIDGLVDRRIRYTVSQGKMVEPLVSVKPLGATLDREQNATTYRLFAPRAKSVFLCLFDTPHYEMRGRKVDAVERYPLWKDEADGVWEISLLGLDTGRYYSFNVDGPAGEGESFFPDAQVGDPYALAAAHSMNNAIVIDPAATTSWFEGWTDQAYRTPSPRDMLIYETHVRDFTIDPSSGVPAPLRGTYEGFAAAEGVGLDHLKTIGVNMIELMPVNEFENGMSDYGWGYSTVFYFAPEASYAREPLKGSQFYEFKRLVNRLHNRGFGVILDVVYNHVGSPNLFNLIDRKYFFRLTSDYKFQNNSGCGNDIRSEAPMMRKFIVDNVTYWMTEHHVDGFRFDLGELIDMETMLAVRAATQAINTNSVVISEPWSPGRGENKRDLKGTGWSAWNDSFRWAATDFTRGKDNRDGLKKVLLGSVDIWSANPLQAINYLESHDDMTFADMLSISPNKDGLTLQPYEADLNRLAATVLFTSLGIPMIAEGQEFMRSKAGNNNSYNKGDAINAVRWADRNRPIAAATMSYYGGLAAMRLSPQGAAFRLAEPAAADYYQWIDPPNNRALGYIVNAAHVREGNGFVVLLNASDQTVGFQVPLPAGQWKVIGNGEVINLAGLPDQQAMTGPQSAMLTVPPVHSMILMDGF